MMKFKSIPVAQKEVEVMQFTKENKNEVFNWLMWYGARAGNWHGVPVLYIPTDSGIERRVTDGDYVVLTEESYIEIYHDVHSLLAFYEGPDMVTDLLETEKVEE